MPKHIKRLKKKIVDFIKANQKEVAILVFILVLASFLRLYRIDDYLIFLGDEGRDVLVVKRMIVDRKFTLLGPQASIGSFYLGPIYYYFMLPFLWLFRLNPVGPAVMVALFGIATVFLVYLTGRDFFNYKVGLLAAFLYSISPSVIIQSRSSWNPNPMPFFSLLIIWLLRKSLKKEGFFLLGLVGFFFGIALQLHYLATFLAVVVAAYFLIFSPQRKKIKAYVWLGAGFVVGWLPFLIFELRHRFPNSRTLYYFLSSGKETGFAAQKFIPIVKDVYYRVFSHLVASQQPILSTILILLSFLFVFFWIRERKSKELFKTLGLLFIWLIIGVGLFGLYKNNIYNYYFGFLFPSPFLIISYCLIKLSEFKKIGIFLTIAIFVGLTWINFKDSPLKYTPNRQLENTRSMAKFIFDKTGDEPYNLALIAARNTDKAYRYFLEISEKAPVIIEPPQIDPERKTVTDNLFVICEDMPCSPIGHPLWEIAGFGMAEIKDRWEVNGLEVYQLVHIQSE